MGDERLCASNSAANNRADRWLAKKRGWQMNASFVIGRAALAVLLMIGFYVLALGIAFALLWVPYAEFVYAHHITPKLALICSIGGGLILWSVLPRWDRFRAPGPLMTRKKHPRLFNALERVADATK